jgi:hypothetical protein
MNVSPLNSADLFLPCGLCCDGSAALRPQEETIARTLGLLVFKPVYEIFLRKHFLPQSPRKAKISQETPVMGE